jgi:Flp pilus assembly protein TadD
MRLGFVLLTLAAGADLIAAPVATPRAVAAPTPIAVTAPAPADPKFRLAPSADLNEPGKRKASEDIQKIFKRAIVAMARGDLAAAREGFLKVLENVPDNVPTMINLGLVEYRSKNLEEAENRLRSAVRLAPESSIGWMIRGIVQYDRGHYDQALASLAQAAVLDPRNPMVHQYLGVTIGQKGWFSGAEDEMRKAIELDPQYAEAHFNLAVFYLQRNPPAVELARRHYQRALELGAAPDPDVEKSLTPPKE